MLIASALSLYMIIVSVSAMQDADLLQRGLWYPKEGVKTGEPREELGSSLSKRSRRQRELPVAVPIQVAQAVNVDPVEDPVFALTLRDMIHDDEMDQIGYTHTQSHLLLRERLVNYMDGDFFTNIDDDGGIVADAGTVFMEEEVTMRRLRIAVFCCLGVSYCLGST